jgi:hypothetical protein
MDRYSKGILFVLTIPDNFADLYNLPPEVLSLIKYYSLGSFPVRLDAPGKVSLFAYDNQTFVVESFADTKTDATVAITNGFSKIKNLVTGEVITGEAAPVPQWPRVSFGPQRTNFKITLEPHTYAAFAEVK